MNSLLPILLLFIPFTFAHDESVETNYYMFWMTFLSFLIIFYTIFVIFNVNNMRVRFPLGLIILAILFPPLFLILYILILIALFNSPPPVVESNARSINVPRSRSELRLRSEMRV